MARKHLPGMPKKRRLRRTYLTSKKGRTMKGIPSRRKPRLQYSANIGTRNQHHNGNQHKCEKCPYGSKSTFFLTNHIKRHKHRQKQFNCQKAILERYYCKECYFITSCTISFKQHFHHFHQVKADQEEKQHKAEVEVQKWFHCTQCNYKSLLSFFVSKHYLVAHNNEQKPYKCKYSQCRYRGRNQASLNIHVSLQHTGQYWCKKCHYECHTLKEMNTHFFTAHSPNDVEETVREEKQGKEDEVQEWFHCTQCEFKAPLIDKSKRHYASAHKIERIPCTHTQCLYRAKDLDDLEAHVSRQHTNQYKCIQCPYQCATINEINEHYSTTHQLSFQCTSCEFRTASSYNLNRHSCLGKRRETNIVFIIQSSPS